MSAVFPINADTRFRISTATGGQTAFSVPFPFQANIDIAVIKIDGVSGAETVLTETTHYTLTGAGEPAGGTATLVAGAAAGDKYLRIGRAHLVRVLSILRNGKFRSRPIDDDIDRFILIAQELQRESDRSIKVPYGSTVPQLIPRPGEVVVWDDNGNFTGGGVLNPDTDAQFATRPLIKALIPLFDGQAVYLTEKGRAGWFIWRTGNYSAEVARDTLEGVYLKANSVAASAGAWLRDGVGMAQPLNVLWFGADPTNTSDSAPAVKGARDVLQYDSVFRGGIIDVPRGTFKLNSTVAFTSYSLVHNIYIRGAGVMATAFDCTGAPAGSDCFSFDGGAHFGVSDLAILGAPRDGLMMGESGSDNAFNFYARNLRIQFCGRYNIATQNSYGFRFENIWSRGATAACVALLGFHTSFTLENVLGAESAAGNGFIVKNAVYGSLVNCGADANLWGYNCSCLQSVSWINCGAEVNARDGWLFQTSDALASGVIAQAQDIHGVKLDGCYALNNSHGNPGTYASFLSLSTANNRPIDITLENCISYRENVADAAVIATGTSGAITVHDASSNVLEGGYFSSGTFSRLTRAEPTKGTTTPAIVGTSTAGAGTYSVQTCRWTRIDDRLWFDLTLVWSAHTGTGNVSIATNLPVNAAGDAALDIYESNVAFTAGGFLQALMGAGGSVITIAQNAAGTVGLVPMDTAGTLIISGCIRV